MIDPSEIAEARYKMEKARKGKHWLAYRDQKKHYDRLLNQFKKEWGLR